MGRPWDALMLGFSYERLDLETIRSLLPQQTLGARASSNRHLYFMSAGLHLPHFENPRVIHQSKVSQCCSARVALREISLKSLPYPWRERRTLTYAPSPLILGKVGIQAHGISPKSPLISTALFQSLRSFLGWGWAVSKGLVPVLKWVPCVFWLVALDLILECDIYCLGASAELKSKWFI